MIPLLKEIGGGLINGEDKGVDDFAEVDVMVGCGLIWVQNKFLHKKRIRLVEKLCICLVIVGNFVGDYYIVTKFSWISLRHRWREFLLKDRERWVWSRRKIGKINR